MKQFGLRLASHTNHAFLLSKGKPFTCVFVQRISLRERAIPRQSSIFNGGSNIIALACLLTTYFFLVFVGTDGGYSKWSDWSSCSVTCGGGLMWRNRQCNNPMPSGDGKTCKEQSLGPEKQSKPCNSQKCGMTFSRQRE